MRNIKRFETTYKEGVALILSDTGLYIKEEVKTEEAKTEENDDNESEGENEWQRS